MKKTLLFLGLLSLSSNLFGMEQEQTQPQQVTQKTQLSRWDKVKIGGALIGCTFFTAAALLMKDYCKCAQEDEESFYHIPSVIAIALPVALLYYSIVKPFESKLNGKLNEFAYRRYAAKAGIVYSSILAIALGRYAYKKLTQSKTVSKTKP